MPKPFPTLVVLMLVLLSQTGCSTFKVPQLSREDSKYQSVDPGTILSGSESSQVYTAIRQARNQNSIVLHLVNDESQPIRILPLPEGGESVFVSTLLEQTGTIKMLGSVNVVLYRSSTNSIDGIRMVVKMEKNGEKVRPETDYALQAGDRIRVAKVESDAMQSLINMTLGLN